MKYKKGQKNKLESDTISRQAAINAIENTDVEITAEEWDELTNAIESLPPANTDLSDYIDRLWKIAYERGKSERPKGEWMKRSSVGNWECSLCGSDVIATEKRITGYNYCPNCGTRMKGVV